MLVGTCDVFSVERDGDVVWPHLGGYEHDVVLPPAPGCDLGVRIRCLPHHVHRQIASTSHAGVHWNSQHT